MSANRIAFVLGVIAVALGVLAVGLDLYRGNGFDTAPLAVSTVGLVVIAVSRSRDSGRS